MYNSHTESKGCSVLLQPFCGAGRILLQQSILPESKSFNAEYCSTSEYKRSPSNLLAYKRLHTALPACPTPAPRFVRQF